MAMLGLADLDAEMMAEEGDEQPSKRTAVGQTPTERVAKMEALQIQMAKLLLSTSLAARTLKAIGMDCYRIETENKYTVAMKTATQKYQAWVTKLRANLGPDQVKEKAGVPSVHIYNAMLGVYLKELEQTAPEEAARLSKLVEGWNWQLIHQHCPHVRLCKMWEGSFKKLEISVPMKETYAEINKMGMACSSLKLESGQKYAIENPTTVWGRIEVSLLAASNKHRRMLGMAPAGDLERKVQEYLDSLK